LGLNLKVAGNFEFLSSAAEAAHIQQRFFTAKMLNKEWRMGNRGMQRCY
jgi:hypothetical protein